jgi:hypothetical protein
MKKFKFLLTGLMLLTFAVAVYAFNNTKSSAESKAACCCKGNSCPMKVTVKAENGECCDMPDCCCKKGDSCPMKKNQKLDNLMNFKIKKTFVAERLFYFINLDMPSTGFEPVTKRL